MPATAEGTGDGTPDVVETTEPAVKRKSSCLASTAVDEEPEVR